MVLIKMGLIFCTYQNGFDILYISRLAGWVILVVLSLHFLRGTKTYCKKRRIPFCLFHKRHKTTSNAIFHMRKVDTDEP